MEGVDGKNNVLDGYSPATNFEIQLNEVQQRNKKCPSSDRALAVFKVFDEVLPQLGIFQKVLKMVRDETFEAVYSHQYTSSKEQHTNYNPATNVVADRSVEDRVFIQRIPYFSLVQRVYESRHEEAEQLKEEIRVLEKRLSDKTMQHNDALTEITSLKNEIQDLQHTVEDREEDIRDRDEVIQSKDDEISTLKEEFSMQKLRLEYEKRKLQEEVDNLKKEVEFLTHYKQGYDALEEAFIFRPGEDKFTHAPKRSRKPALATKKNHLLTNYEAAKRIEQQLLLVRNQTIEEYDAFVEGHMAELKGRVFKEKSEDEILPDRAFDEDEIAIERLDMELSGMQERFQQTIEALNNELDMIRQHKDYIEHQLDEIDKVARASAKPPSRVMFRSTGNNPNSAGGGSASAGVSFGKQSRLSGKESTMSTGDNLENVDLLASEMDPFVPQEAILSKYSIMVYTSTNSKKTFHELKDAKFCASCGEKTVICPHKVSGEKVIILPHNCTHIKLSRPRVRIQAERKDKDYHKPHPPSKSRKGAPASGATVSTNPSPKKTRPRPVFTGSASTQDEGQVVGGGGESAKEKTEDAREEEKEEAEEEDGEDKKEGGEESSAQEQQENSFMLLWDDYKQRTGQTRYIPRPLELRRVLSIISQFYSYVFWQDEHVPDAPMVSVMDTLYTHLEERYLIKEVAHLCMHDFICGVIEYASNNKFIQIFAHILVGNLDATVFRYLLTITDLIDRVEWHFVEDFKFFIMAVYPFLNEDEVDQLHLGYTSFSENKISKALVFEYFMYVILKYREPRFQDIEMKLSQRPGRKFGVMSEREFNEAGDALAPLANETFRHRLFVEALEHYSEDGRVAISRLSHILSYLLLLQVAPLLRQKISDTVEDSRIRSASQSRAGPIERPVAATAKSDKGEEEKIITMTQLKNLAKNVARRSQNRSVRRIEGNLRMDIDDMAGDIDTFDELPEYSGTARIVLGSDFPGEE